MFLSSAQNGAQKKRKLKLKKTKSEISQTKVPKGYRLRPSTHKLIKRLQRLMNTSQDAIISKSVRLFAKGTKKLNSKNNLITNFNKGNTTNENNKTF